MRSRLFFTILFALFVFSALAENASAYYSTQMGRFISRDPIGYAANDENLYRYVFNKPLNATDPTGLATQKQQALLNLCWDALGTARQEMKDFLKEMSDAGCRTDRLYCATNCDKNCKDNKGYHLDGKAVICVENFTGNLRAKMVETWRHELSHLYDHCIANRPGYKINDSCRRILCTEIRAASIGECRDGGSGRQGGKSFVDCVVENAVKATKKTRAVCHLITDPIDTTNGDGSIKDVEFQQCVYQSSGGVIPKPAPWPYVIPKETTPK